MICGYARVSTRGQSKDGNSLSQQTKQLKAAGVEKIYTDAFTGTSSNRPEFIKLINELNTGDTLIVTKLDRFARSLAQGSALITRLIDRGIKINVLNIGIMDNSSSGKLIRNIFLAFAEFERDMIIQRTAEGKAIAKQDPNFKEGRPKKYTTLQINHALDLLNNHSYKQVEAMTGISKSTLIRAKRQAV